MYKRLPILLFILSLSLSYSIDELSTLDDSTDLSDKNISGKKAESILERAGITTNKNMVPFDKRSPLVTSGIRIGTPALTTRGMGESEMIIIAKLINLLLDFIICHKKSKF